MFHWELDGSMKIRVYDWGYALHKGENVEPLWHAKIEEAKENLKKKKWWVGPELFKVYNRRHQNSPKYYTMAENYTVSKLARRLWDHGHDPILYAGDHDPIPLVQRFHGKPH